MVVDVVTAWEAVNENSAYVSILSITARASAIVITGELSSLSDTFTVILEIDPSEYPVPLASDIVKLPSDSSTLSSWVTKSIPFVVSPSKIVAESLPVKLVAKKLPI